jgi:hypothetical protein
VTTITKVAYLARRSNRAWEEVEMDDSGGHIGRRDLLRWGFTGAAAAVVATVVEPGVAGAAGSSPAGGELAGAVDLRIEWTFTDSRSTLKITGTVDGWAGRGEAPDSAVRFRPGPALSIAATRGRGGPGAATEFILAATA